MVIQTLSEENKDLREQMKSMDERMKGVLSSSVVMQKKLDIRLACQECRDSIMKEMGEMTYLSGGF